MKTKTTLDALCVRLRAAREAACSYAVRRIREAVARLDVAVRVSYAWYVVSVVLLAVPALTGMRLWKVVRDLLIELWNVFFIDRQLGRTYWKAHVAE